VFVFAMQSAFFGCGYHLQGARNELLEKEGVRRVYVKPLVNNTFKTGVENVVYNALVKTLISHERVKIVMNKDDADAVIEGVVQEAQFKAVGWASADRLAPLSSNLPAGANQIQVSNLNTFSVATVFSADLRCDFTLDRKVPVPGKKKNIWRSSFAASKPFPASNQLDVPGTTSALINESEFERAMGELATGMMDEVHESMLGMF
jgi:hypothetical protein